MGVHRLRILLLIPLFRIYIWNPITININSGSDRLFGYIYVRLQVRT
jgi:hypothetical protein